MLKQSKRRTADVYPPDAIVESSLKQSIIVPDEMTIPMLFNERVNRDPDKKAYTQYEAESGKWVDYTWLDSAINIQKWRKALSKEKLAAGERVIVRLRNCYQWILFDQASMASSLTVVPVFVEDRPENIAYIIEQTEARLLLLETLAQWDEMKSELDKLRSLQRVLLIEKTEIDEEDNGRVVNLQQWLANADEHEGGYAVPKDSDALATIVFTSGTTGKPKGVMLSHRNMLENAHGSLQSVAVTPEDRFLSFLPLSHMLERTVGYYLPIMAGAHVSFNRSIPELLDDLAVVRPSGLITVPRIFERAYNRIHEQLDEGPDLKKKLFMQAIEIGWHRFERRQKRRSWHPVLLLWPIFKLLVARKVGSRFGGKLRLVISGGAPLAAHIAKTFVGLGIEILQGYGLTETSPVLSVNTLVHNKPDTIGFPLRNVKLRLGEDDELQAKGSCVMLGYWNNPQATDEVIDDSGWLCSGDIGCIDNEGFVSITGRIKEIIVMANGEKVPPADMEAAICNDPLFDQAMVMGEGKPYLSALVVINPQLWTRYVAESGIDPTDLQALRTEQSEQFAITRIAKQLEGFPGYANVRRVILLNEVWTTQNGLLTPTLKIKRPVLRERFAAERESMYLGH